MLGTARAHFTELEKQRRYMESVGEKGEVKRLDNIKTPLITIIERLNPNEDEADYFRAVQDSNGQDMSVRS